MSPVFYLKTHYSFSVVQFVKCYGSAVYCASFLFVKKISPICDGQQYKEISEQLGPMKWDGEAGVENLSSWLLLESYLL